MILGLCSAIGTAVLFVFLFIRSAINNGKLKAENAEISKDVDIKQKQLEIVANHPDTPESLRERMRKGTL